MNILTAAYNVNEFWDFVVLAGLCLSCFAMGVAVAVQTKRERKIIEDYENKQQRMFSYNLEKGDTFLAYVINECGSLDEYLELPDEEQAALHEAWEKQEDYRKEIKNILS